MNPLTAARRKIDDIICVSRRKVGDEAAEWERRKKERKKEEKRKEGRLPEKSVKAEPELGARGKSRDCLANQDLRCSFF